MVRVRQYKLLSSIIHFPAASGHFIAIKYKQGRQSGHIIFLLVLPLARPWFPSKHTQSSHNTTSCAAIHFRITRFLWKNRNYTKDSCVILRQREDKNILVARIHALTSTVWVSLTRDVFYAKIFNLSHTSNTLLHFEFLLLGIHWVASKDISIAWEPEQAKPTALKMVKYYMASSDKS